LVIALRNRVKPPLAPSARAVPETASPNVEPTPALLRVGPDKDSIILEPWSGGQMLARSVPSGTALLFDPRHPDSARRLQLGQDLSSIAALPDGGLIYGTNAGVIGVAAAPGQRGSELGRLPGGPVVTLAVSADPKLVVASDSDGHVGVWSLSNKRQLSRLRLEFTAVLVDFLDAATLSVATHGGELARYTVTGRAKGGYDLPNVGSAGRFTDAALSPDRRHVALVSGEMFNTPPVMWVVELIRGVEENTPDELEPGSPAFSADGQLLAVCSDAKVSLYNFATQKLHSRPLRRDVHCSSLAVVPGADANHPLVISGHTDGRLLIMPF
jgi:WD40 repeat protein